MRSRPSAWAVIVVVAAALWPLAALAGPLDWSKPPVDISADGHRIDSLFYTVTWMLLVLFLILTAVLVISMVAHRSNSKHHVHYHIGEAPRDLMIATTISAVIFFGVDGTLLVNSYQDIKQAFWNYPADSPELTRVQIMPQQWAWRFRLPGDDNEFNTQDDIVTTNDLRVPAGKRVLAQLQSRDVIHSFFLPNVRQKQDANPGAVTKMTFQPNTPGTYEVVCAEMCGLAHYKMRAEMTVMEPAEYAVWHAEASRWAMASFDAEDADAQWGWTWGTN
jgi:cytochrome c oxidase subunit 2